MTVFWLAFFGLFEFIFRVLFVFLAICTLIGAAILIDYDIREMLNPYLWKLLDAHVRNW